MINFSEKLEICTPTEIYELIKKNWEKEDLKYSFLNTMLLMPFFEKEIINNEYVLIDFSERLEQELKEKEKEKNNYYSQSYNNIKLYLKKNGKYLNENLIAYKNILLFKVSNYDEKINEKLSVEDMFISFNNKPEEKLSDFIVKTENNKDLIEKSFKILFKRLDSFVAFARDGVKNSPYELVLKNLEEFKKFYGVKSINDKKTKLLRQMFSNFLSYYDGYYNNNKAYMFLKKIDNINDVLPYVLNKSINSSILSNVFDELNKENKILVTIQELAQDPSSKIFADYFRQTIKENKNLYEEYNTSKIVERLINKYTETKRKEYDITKIMKYKYTVSVALSKQILKEMFPEINPKTLSDYLSSSVEDTGKIYISMYNGKYQVLFHSDEEINNENFAKYILENIITWVENNISFTVGLEDYEKEIRKNKLTKLINESEDEQKVVKRKKI